MKKLAVAFLVSWTFMTSGFADQSVRGYVRKDGTVVQPYVRSDANDTRNDNYSTRGNANPYNGRQGTKPRDEDN